MEQRGGGAQPCPHPTVPHYGTHLREPLKRQATKRPGSPGMSCSTSITKYNTSCGGMWDKRGTGGGGRGREGERGLWGGGELRSHLIGGSVGAAGGQRVLAVVDEHDEAGEAAEAQYNLLAGEDGVAGAAGATGRSEVGRDGGERGRSPHAPPAPLTAPPASRCGSSGSAAPAPGSPRTATAS